MTILSTDYKTSVPTVVMLGCFVMVPLPHIRLLQNPKNPLQSVYGDALLETG